MRVRHRNLIHVARSNDKRWVLYSISYDLRSYLAHTLLTAKVNNDTTFHNASIRYISSYQHYCTYIREVSSDVEIFRFGQGSGKMKRELPCLPRRGSLDLKIFPWDPCVLSATTKGENPSTETNPADWGAKASIFALSSSQHLLCLLTVRLLQVSVHCQRCDSE